METGLHRYLSRGCGYGPHSLGKSVEWKRALYKVLSAEDFRGPHSLGKSVEWKPLDSVPELVVWSGPHSLGKSVEWKLKSDCPIAGPWEASVPTRWGNQLNGNTGVCRGDR